MKRCCLFFILVCTTESLTAQFNDSTDHHLNYLGSGTFNNSDGKRFVLLNNVLKFSIRKKQLVLNSSNSWIYGRQDEALINNDFSSALDFNLYKTWPRFNYWGLGTFDKSYSLKIRNRFQVGLGAAYNLFEKPHFVINISDGIIYEQSNQAINDSTDLFTQTFRNSLRLRYTLSWAGRFRLESTHFFQQSFSTGSDYIIKSNNTLLVTIRKGLHITSSLVYNRLNYTRRENLITSFGVSVEKFF